MRPLWELVNEPDRSGKEPETAFGGRTGKVSRRKAGHMSFGVGSERRRRKGVTAGPTERRCGAEGFGPSTYLRDPEGNTVELKGSPER